MVGDDSEEHAPPGAGALIASLRALGYDLPHAVADVVDNSVTARAATVRIEYSTDAADGWVAIVDDGHGMTERQLHDAMRLAKDGPNAHRHPSDLGRFGLGMKTASFSQARRLTVISGVAPDRLSSRTWDLDHVQRRDDWFVLTRLDEEAASIARQLDFHGPGTLVLWRDLDRLGTGTGLASGMGRVRVHLGAVFGRLLAKGSLRLRVGGQAVTAWDPFLRTHPATQDMGTEVIQAGEATVSVTPYVLPHPSRTAQRDSTSAAGPSGWLRHQGFYVYRQDRLLTLGGWLGLPGLRNGNLSQLVRIAIEMRAQDDHAWQVDVRKTMVIPPQHLRERLVEIAQLARNRSEQVFRHRGASGGGRTGVQEKLVFAWQPDRSRRVTSYRVNRDHPVVAAALAVAPETVRPLLRLLEETVPIGLISADAAAAPERLPQAPMETADRHEVEQLLEAAMSRLPAEPGERDVLRRALRRTEPFNRFPELFENVQTPQEPT